MSRGSYGFGYGIGHDKGMAEGYKKGSQDGYVQGYGDAIGMAVGISFLYANKDKILNACSNLKEMICETEIYKKGVMFLEDLFKEKQERGI